MGSRTKVQKADTGEKFKINKGSTKVTNAYLLVWDLPNGSVYGLPFVRSVPLQLMIHSAFYNEKTKGFSYWMRNNFGEEPVLLSDVDPDIKVKKLVESFEHFGHFGTTADYTLKYRRNKKKVFVNYTVNIAPSYHYSSVNFIFKENQDSVKAILSSEFPSATIKSGDEFNFEILKEEKKKIWQTLQENGFYHISSSDIVIEADTTVGNRQIDLRFSLNDNLSQVKLSKVYIEDINLFIDSVQMDMNASKKLLYKRGHLKSAFLDSLITVKTDTPYSPSLTKQSTNFLSQSRVFNSQTISYELNPLDSTKLIAKVRLIPAKATKLGVSVNANYITSGYMGPSVELNLAQLNLFGKAQNLNVKVNAFYDFPLGLFNDRISDAYGITFAGVYEAPLNLALLRHKKRKSALPKYFVKANLDFIDRQDYFQQIGVNGAYGFNWNTTSFNQHKLNIINVIASDLRKTTPRFDSLLEANTSLGTSLIDQFIVSSSYNYTLDKRKGGNWPEGLYFDTKIEVAGNALNLINVAINDKPNGQKTAFGLRFAQYAQLQYDFRYFHKTGPSSLIAFRTLGAVGFAYGNSDNMPYIKQYYIGGTNSLRPLSARSVGPGRFQQFESGEINQVGDLKFETNLEYRFKMFYKLSGALWADAGNVWLLEEDPNRVGSGVRWDKLFNDSYLTAGVGIRLDLNFLVLRFDYGALLYVPYFEEGQQWVWKHDKPFLGAAIGLGFPF